MPADFTGNQYWQPGNSIDYPSPKPRQQVKQDLTDDAHMATHQPPEQYQDSGNQALDYFHKPANDMMKDRQNGK